MIRSENNCWEAYSVFKSIEYSGFPLYLRSKSLLNNQQDILVKSLLSYYPQYTWQSQRTKGRFTVTFKGAAWQQPDPGNWGHLYRWSEISGGSMD